MPELRVPYGKEVLRLEIPERNLVFTAEPRTPPPFPNPEAEVERALEEPIGTPPFRELLGRGRRVAFLVDNFARATPAYEILPPALTMVKEAGAKAEIIIAAGCLRPMTEGELELKLGGEILRSGVPIHQNQARNTWEFEFLGVTDLGTPLFLNRRFLDADLSVGVGLTQASLWGYTGGGKIVLPGVASYETIEWNHRLSTSRSSGLGHLPPDNRMRVDIDEAAEMAGLTMVVNVILDPQDRIVAVRAGHFCQAHRETLSLYNDYYTFDKEAIPGGPADIGITGSLPGDTFFAHACWSIANLDHVVRDGGTIILASPSPGGLAHFAYAADYMPPTRENLAKYYLDVYYRKQELWHSCLWFPILEVLSRKGCLVVTGEENLAPLERLKLRATTSVKEALDWALARHGDDARVAFLPNAKRMLPRGLSKVESPTSEYCPGRASRHARHLVADIMPASID